MKKSNWYYLFNYGITVIVFVFGILFGKNLLGQDFDSFFLWWAVLVLLSVSVYPMTRQLFSQFHDGGWIFAKMIGVALSGYLMWLLSSLHLMKFTQTGCFFCLIFIGAFSFLLQYVIGKRNAEKVLKFDQDRLRAVIVSEVMFFILFLFWIYARGFRPEVSNTESPMDYGFMAALLRTDYMPPHDMWMSQNSINYYYVGQYMASFLTRLTGVRLNEAYALSLMTVAAGTFSMVYSLAYNLFLTSTEKYKKKGSVLPAFCGTLCAVSATFAANVHYPVKKFIEPFLEKINGLEITSYWFPSSTRYIGYDPVVENDKTIHEFPSYSFILGDLHAHVINLVFVLCVLAILYAFLLRRREIKGPVNWIKEGFDPVILLLGFFIGLFHMTNFWDFPIYYVVCGAVILFSNARRCEFKFDTIKLTAIHGIVILLLGKLVALPFTLKFAQISTRVCFAENHSAFYQLIVLWGLPVITLILFLVNRIVTSMQNEERVIEKNGLFTLLKNLTESDLYVLTIGLCAAGLVLIPEVIYVEDIYGGSYARANTMFKLTYQAFLMFSIVMGYCFFRFLASKNAAFYKVYSVLAGALLIWTCFYSVTAMKSWYGDITKTENYKGLDATAFMAEKNADDYEVIEWLNKNADNSDVILEAHGPSYFSGDQIYERISAFTGLSTVLGWETHEWLWRSESSGAYPDVVKERKEEVEKIYTSEDLNEIKELLKKYQITYLYAGRMEKEAYGSANLMLLKELGEIVYESPANDTKEYESVLIRIGTSD